MSWCIKLPVHLRGIIAFTLLTVSTTCDGDLLFISSGDNNSIVTFDTLTGISKVFASGGMLSAPYGVHLSGPNLLVTNSSSNTLLQFDIASATPSVLQSDTPLQHPGGVTTIPGTTVIYVANTGDNAVQRIPVSSISQSIKSPNLVAPTDLALTRSSDKIYATSPGKSAIVVCDLASQTVSSTITGSGLQSPQGLALSPDNSTLFVSDGATTILAIDLQTLNVSSFATGAPLDHPMGLAISADGASLFVANHGANNILKFDTATHSVKTFSVGSLLNGPTGLSLQPASAQLLNISTRMRVLTGDQVLIAGFIITGTDPKTVIIRGIGPSLTGVGVTLSDPTLELHQGSTVTTNDNWKINDQTGQSQEADIRATTIPPTNDLESAIVATLTPGNYTAILAGKNGGTGVGLVEVYDLAQAANSKLANISSRGFVDTNDNVMIGGLIVGGTGGGTAKVIVRAIGPSLSVNGTPVPGRLADPTLELHNSSGTMIVTNDNWKIDDQTGQSQEAAIRATTVPPTDDLESAIVATLPPDNYTAIVRGKNNTTGVGLVEVYNLQ